MIRRKKRNCTASCLRAAAEPPLGHILQDLDTGLHTPCILQVHARPGCSDLPLRSYHSRLAHHRNLGHSPELQSECSLSFEAPINRMSAPTSWEEIQGTCKQIMSSFPARGASAALISCKGKLVCKALVGLRGYFYYGVCL